MKPQRIQRKRTKGWKMPENSVYVGRPSKWGNPFLISEYGEFAAEMFEDALEWGPSSRFWYYGPHTKLIEIKLGLQKGELKGKNLVCWCALDMPCHADVLLTLANEGSHNET